MSLKKEPTTIPLLINNQPHKTSSIFPIYSPRDGTLLHHCISASPTDINTAITAAFTALPAWRALPPPQKRDIFLRAATLMTNRSAHLRSLMYSETVATSPGFPEFNLMLAPEILRDVACRISSISGSIPVCEEPGVSGLVLKEPFGVVLAIAPWNAPYILGTRAIAYPLAAGNTVVFKGSEISPACHSALVEIMHEAGLPEGVLNFVVCKREDAAESTKKMIEHPAIRKINLTGSTVVGRAIAEVAGRCLKPVLMECGGKCPAIVWEDADLELAAKECAKGAFNHGGQICMSTERILGHRNVVTRFEEEYRKAIEEFAPSGGQAGTLISEVVVQPNKHLIQDAVDKGANIIHGNQDAKEEGKAQMRPVVVKGTTKEMELYDTESFGPTLSLIEVCSEEEAIDLANDTEYGLNSAVFTRDLGRGLRFARGIEAGGVHVNCITVHDETALPHGGVKGSGYGRFNGENGLEEWLKTKTVTFRGC